MKTLNESDVYIILPVYNGEKYLLEQLMSIYYQDYSNWILYIINDGSTDNSMKIAKKYVNDYSLAKKVTIVEKKNGGVNSAINVGLEKIKKECKDGDFLAFCDADDIWARDKLSSQVMFMHNNEECDLSYHDLVIVDQNNNFLKKSIIYGNIWTDAFLELSLGNHITSTEVMFKARYIDIIYPMPEGQGMFQDWRTVLCFSLLAKNIKFLNRKLGFYRSGHQSLSKKEGLKTLYQQSERNLRFFIELKNKFPNKNLEGIIKYNEDKLKWSEKGFLYMYVMVMLHYPRYFMVILNRVMKIICINIFYM